jgi:hypothetical protein
MRTSTPTAILVLAASASVYAAPTLVRRECRAQICCLRMRLTQTLGDLGCAKADKSGLEFSLARTIPDDEGGATDLECIYNNASACTYFSVRSVSCLLRMTMRLTHGIEWELCIRLQRLPSARDGRCAAWRRRGLNSCTFLVLRGATTAPDELDDEQRAQDDDVVLAHRDEGLDDGTPNVKLGAQDELQLEHGADSHELGGEDLEHILASGTYVELPSAVEQHQR